MRFSDALSPGDKLKHVRQSLVAGRILHLHCKFTHPPKNKFAVLVSMEPTLLLFMINSQISEWLKARADLRDRQVTIRQQAHSYLQRDSFLNCTEAIRQITQEEIEGQLVEDMTNIKDTITTEEREAVRYAVTGCRTLSKKDIDGILRALSSS